eukprot:9475540-Pyramimonas_sp.AAC.2
MLGPQALLKLKLECAIVSVCACEVPSRGADLPAGGGALQLCAVVLRIPRPARPGGGRAQPEMAAHHPPPPLRAGSVVVAVDDFWHTKALMICCMAAFFRLAAAVVEARGGLTPSSIA